MDQQLAEQIKRRIAELAAERDRERAEAEKRLFGYAAAIGELERLLAEIPATPEIDLSALQEGNANATAS